MSAIFFQSHELLLIHMMFFFISGTRGGDFILHVQSSDEIIHCRLARKYISSPVEQEWFHSIDHVAEHNDQWLKGCAKMRQDKSAVMEWLHFWQQREQFSNSSGTSDGLKLNLAMIPRSFSENVFSYMEYHQTCSNRPDVTLKVPMEPLMGFLRHPLHHCFPNVGHKHKYAVNKDYMIQPFQPEIFPVGGSNRRNLFFDLGASLYSSGAGGASQQWFFETYKSRGITFDRILAWVSR